MKDNGLTGVAYLEQVLNWKAFAKGHPKLVTALRDVLVELKCYRDKEKIK